jgi:murein DD-endopeptidase MepM/ murein hydrolase activator NlpD
MGKPQFRFNLKTLRYEQVGFSFWRAGGTILAYFSFGFLFFVGLNLLQNFLIETEEEKSLASENNSLIEYKAVLTTQLQESTNSLHRLNAEEKHLNEELFDTPAEKSIQPAAADLSIPVDADFEIALNALSQKFSLTRQRAKESNETFGDRLRVTKKDLPGLFSLPSLPPTKELTAAGLVSGFGNRINPFHKGNYHHDGIDIALPKGTAVIATGNGRVYSYSNSNLEAGYGNYIEIDHGNGYLTRYSHLDKISVTWGQIIKQGQVIGLSGSSGGSVAPHLHYEVLRNGKNVDPIHYIVRSISPTLHQELALKSKIQNQSLD